MIMIRIPTVSLFALFALSLPAHSQTRVGPPKGTVFVVGGGQIGPEVWSRFIAAAGGPDALIIDVPTAGGDSVYPASHRAPAGLYVAGAKNVVVFHTIDRKVADSDSFVAVLKKAGGVWFEGGRQWHLVDSYAGTKSEQEFMNVLCKGRGDRRVVRGRVDSGELPAPGGPLRQRHRHGPGL